MLFSKHICFAFTQPCSMFCFSVRWQEAARIQSSWILNFAVSSTGHFCQRKSLTAFITTARRARYCWFSRWGLGVERTHLPKFTQPQRAGAAICTWEAWAAWPLAGAQSLWAPRTNTLRWHRRGTRNGSVISPSESRLVVRTDESMFCFHTLVNRESVMG